MRSRQEIIQHLREMHNALLQKGSAVPVMLDAADMLEKEVPAVKVRRVRLKLDYDLRTDQVAKSMDCAKGEDWTAFINKRRNMVHVMRYDHPALLIRLPRVDMKDLGPKAIRALISRLLYEGL